MEDVISRRAREAFGDTGRRCVATNRAGGGVGDPTGCRGNDRRGRRSRASPVGSGGGTGARGVP